MRADALGSTGVAWEIARRFDPRWALHRLRGRDSGRRGGDQDVVGYWDERYAEEPDLFDLERDRAESARYEFLLEALSDRPLGRTLELGCSVGVLTAMIAERTESVTATDISEVVLETARERLAAAGYDGVELRQADLPDGVPEGPFDTIVASELLYYLRADEVAESAARLAAVLAPGGRLLTAHTRGYFPRHALSADHVARLVGRAPGLRFVERWSGRQRRVDLFERTS